MWSGKLHSFFQDAKIFVTGVSMFLHNNSSTKPQSNYKKIWIRDLDTVSWIKKRIKNIKSHLSLICFKHVYFKICWHPSYVNKNTYVMRADDMHSNRSCKPNCNGHFLFYFIIITYVGNRQDVFKDTCIINYLTRQRQLQIK